MTRKRDARKTETETPWNERFLFKYGSRLILGITVIVVFLTLAQCTIEKPEAPEWNTRLTVPVVNRTYDMEELVNKIDQEGLEIDQDGNITFRVTEDLDTVMLDAAALATDDLSYSVTEALGAVSIDPPVIAPISVTLASITGLGAGLPGDSAIISALSFDIINTMPAITNFSQATIASGNVLVVVENDLGIALDTAIVEIYDVGNAATLVTDTFPTGIPAGGTDSLSVSLAGKSLSNELRVNAHCFFPGGTINSVSSRFISTELVFPSGLSVSSAVAQVPALNMAFAEQVQLGETERIDTATMATGQLVLTVENATNLSANLSIGIPDLVTSGLALSIDTTIPAQGQVQIVRALAGSQLVPGGSSLPQQIDINVTADVPGSGGQQVAVNQSDSFFVQADLTSLTFGSVTGVFSSTDATFDAESFPIDVPTGFDSLELVSAVLTLDIENGTNLPGYLDIQLSGDNGKTLALTGNIAIGASGAPVTTTITNSDIADFISPLPSNVEAGGTVTFGDGVTQSTISANDFVFSRVGIVAPLEMVIHESQIETDIERESINQEDIDMVTDHVVEAGFVYNIVNHLPLGASVEIFIGPDSATLYANPGLTIGPLAITAAPVSGAGLVLDTAATGYQEIMLTNADIQILKSDTLYIGQELILEGSNGQSVKLM
ncbi:MAG: hypothetical protein OEV68_18075, partial [candidate division Zixibacteria bacterium]|nr:hypothetical protein [candidate division Zixibacteria bacterium]